MRKVSLIVGFCTLVALGLTLVAQEQELKPIMQSNRMTLPSLNMSIMAKDASAATAAAQKLQQKATESGLFAFPPDIDLKVVLSANSLMVLGLGLMPGGLMALCLSAMTH